MRETATRFPFCCQPFLRDGFAESRFTDVGDFPVSIESLILPERPLVNEHRPPQVIMLATEIRSKKRSRLSCTPRLVPRQGRPPRGVQVRHVHSGGKVDPYGGGLAKESSSPSQAWVPVVPECEHVVGPRGITACGRPASYVEFQQGDDLYMFALCEDHRRSPCGGYVLQ